jgi:ADP-heptose:LPS heptosyltransferase
MPELGYFYSRTRTARKVIVVDLGFLGDTVHLVPALWELKRGYSEASLHVLTSTVGAEVLRLVPCVDKVWALEMQAAKRTLKQQWQILRALRREHFDVAFNFSGADRTLFMTALTGARWRVAYPGGRRHFWNQLLIRHWAPRQDPNRVVFEQRRAVLAACGLSPGEVRFDLAIDEPTARWAASVVPPFAMHLSLNSAKPTREWPLEHHAQMLLAVWREHPRLAVLATSAANPREQERLRQFTALLHDPRLQVLPGNLNIPQLAALLRRSRLHLGPDSGVLHLAVALGVPTVSFFREQGAFRSFMPSGPLHRVISAACHCIDHRNAPCEQLGRAECFAGIQPARVAQLVMELLRQDRLPGDYSPATSDP